jgi:Fe-S cluster assembly protein SufD
MAPAAGHERAAGQAPQPMKDAGSYLETFQRLALQPAQPQLAWLQPVRQAALARFAELGFPTLADEDWRYTSLAPLARLPLRPALPPSDQGVAAAQVEAHPLAGLAGDRLVFVDGYFAPGLSRLGPRPPGVRITNLATVAGEEPALVQPHLGRPEAGTDNAFAVLNTAFFTDGAFIHVPPGQVVELPVHLVFVASGREAGATTHPRNLIIAGARSRLTVIESYFGEAGAPYFTNAVTELAVGEAAAVEHLKLQNEAAAAFHLASLRVRMGRGCDFTSHSLALGSRLSRYHLYALLEAEGVECVLNGLYLAQGDQLVDHHMTVDHAQPRGTSREYFHGILAGAAKGVFHGRILVRPQARKTDAKQTNKNLLLSDTATIDTKPQLEIYADDVKCTHGATVGQLSEDAIFLLRSRGIGLATARRMLIHAFAGEIIERVKHARLREELDRLVWARLGSATDMNYV